MNIVSIKCILRYLCVGGYNDISYVTYRCSWCGHESVWDFGIAPMPILRR